MQISHVGLEQDKDKNSIQPNPENKSRGTNQDMGYKYFSEQEKKHQKPPSGFQRQISYHQEVYIGESLSTFGERFKEHIKAPSSVFDHCNTIDLTALSLNKK